jgi:hypothetical protein
LAEETQLCADMEAAEGAGFSGESGGGWGEEEWAAAAAQLGELGGFRI